MIKFIFKWLIRLVVLAVVLVVILLLSRNAILRVYLEHQIRAQTGMDAEIGSFSVGLAEPTVTIQNLRLYNPPDFAGTPFLDIREIHVGIRPRRAGPARIAHHADAFQPRRDSTSSKIRPARPTSFPSAWPRR